MAAYQNYQTTTGLYSRAVGSVGDDTLDERFEKYGVHAPFRHGISYNHLASYHFVDTKGRQYTPEHTHDDSKARVFYVRLPKGITRKENRQLSEGEPLYLDDMLDFPHVGEDLELRVKDLDQRDTTFCTSVSLVLEHKTATAKVVFMDELPIVRSERENRRRSDRERDRERKK